MFWVVEIATGAFDWDVSDVSAIYVFRKQTELILHS